MRAFIHLPIITALVLAMPSTLLHAQSPWDRSSSPAENEGYSRGYRAGEEDSRRGQAFDYRDESDYRSADSGYRSQYGSRDRYRDIFRLGFERGYGEGYGRYRDDYGYNNGGYNNGNGRGWGRGRAGNSGIWGTDRYGSGYGRNNVAYQIGFTDGYDEGVKDGRDRKRFDPVAESRYRSGDHGYNSRYGTRDAYKIDYRRAFLDGYDRGYQDGRRNYNGGVRWWPF